MAQIVYRDENFQTLYVDVNAQHPEVTIGRHQDNMLVIAKKALSRYHAKALFQNGRYYLVDLNSSNGTYVNNQRITQQEIKPGDLLRFGDINTEFIETAAASAPPSIPVPQNIPPMSVPRQAGNMPPQGMIPSQGMMPPRTMPAPMPSGMVPPPPQTPMMPGNINRPISGNGPYRPTIPNQPSYEEDMARIEASSALPATGNVGISAPPPRNASAMPMPPSMRHAHGMPAPNPAPQATVPSAPPVPAPAQNNLVMDANVAPASFDPTTMGRQVQPPPPAFIEPSEATCAEPLNDIIETANAAPSNQEAPIPAEASNEQSQSSDDQPNSNFSENNQDPNTSGITARSSYDPALQRRQPRSAIYSRVSPIAEAVQAGSSQEQPPQRMHTQPPQYGGRYGRGAQPQRQRVSTGHTQPSSSDNEIQNPENVSASTEIPTNSFVEAPNPETAHENLPSSDPMVPQEDHDFEEQDPGSRSVIIEMPMGFMEESSDDSVSQTSIPRKDIPHEAESQPDQPASADSGYEFPQDFLSLKAELLAKISEIEVLKNQIAEMSTQAPSANPEVSSEKLQEIETAHRIEIEKLKKEYETSHHNEEISHHEEIEKLKKEYEISHHDEVEKLRHALKNQEESYQMLSTQLDELETQHKAEIAQLKAQHEEDITSLKSENNGSGISEEKLQEIETAHQNEIIKIREEIQGELQERFNELLNERIDEVTSQSEAEIAQLNAEHEETVAKLKTNPEEILFSPRKLQEMETEHQKALAEAKEQGHRETTDKYEAILKEKESSFQEKLDELNARYEAETADHKADTAKYEADVAKYKADVTKYEADIAIFEAEASKHEAEVAKHEAESAQHETETAKHQAEITQLKEDLEKSDTELSKLKSEISRIKKNSDEEAAQYEEQIAALNEQLNQKQLEQTDNANLTNSYESQIAELKSRITRMQEEMEAELDQVAQEAADDTAAHFKEKIAALQQNQQKAIEQAANDAADETAAHFEARIAELQQTQQEEIDKAVINATQKYEAQIADLHQIQQVAVEKAIKETNDQAAQQYEAQIEQLRQDQQSAIDIAIQKSNAEMAENYERQIEALKQEQLNRIQATEQTFKTQIDELNTRLQSHETDCTDEFKQLWRSRFTDIIGYAENLERVADKLNMNQVDAKSLEHIHSILDVLRFCAAELDN